MIQLMLFIFKIYCIIGPLTEISCPGIYLASSELYFAAEKCFSSEANVCSSGHGGLKPQKIERCMRSHIWLKQGIQVTWKF